MVSLEENKPRIALLTWSLPGGGVETYMFRLAKYLSSRGYPVDIVTSDAPGDWFDKVKDTGARAQHIARRPDSSELEHAEAVGQWLAKQQYHVIFNNGSRFAQASIAQLDDSTIYIPVVHVDEEYVYNYLGANAVGCNLYLAVSPRVQMGAQRLVAPCPVVCISNGVAIPAPLPERQRSISSMAVKAIYVGRLDHKQKGILLLPAIIAQCVNAGIQVQLTVVGDGQDREALAQACQHNQVADRVTLLGMVKPDEVYGLLQASDICLMPSRYEGLPTILLECQACGCVPIASYLPDITDVAVEDRVSGLLVTVDDVQAFASAVAFLATHPEQWRVMSEAAHTRVQAQFSIEQIGRSYEGVIADALAGRYPLARSRKALPAINVHCLTPAIVGITHKSLRLLGLAVLKRMYRHLLPTAGKQYFRKWRAVYLSQKIKVNSR